MREVVGYIGLLEERTQNWIFVLDSSLGWVLDEASDGQVGAVDLGAATPIVGQLI